MRRNISGLIVFFGIFVLPLLTVFTNPGFAQDENADQQLYTFSCYQVKPGMYIEFENFVKNAIPDLKKMSVTQMYVFKTANFGVANKYFVVTPMQDPAAIDTELFAARTSVPVDLVSVMSAVQRMVMSARAFTLIPQPDLNIPLADGYEIKLVVNITVDVVPGRDEDFKNDLKKVVGALGKTKVKGVLVGKVGIGGSMDQYIVNVFYDSFKDMMENQQAIQKELAALDLKPLTGMVSSRKSEVLIRIPELCIIPEAR